MRWSTGLSKELLLRGLWVSYVLLKCITVHTEDFVTGKAAFCMLDISAHRPAEKFPHACRWSYVMKSPLTCLLYVLQASDCLSVENMYST